MSLTLQPLTLKDISSFTRHANNQKIANHLTNHFPHPYTEADAEKFIKMTQQDMPRHVLGIFINNEAIGAIGVHPQQDIFKKNAEMGYWIGETFWGQGIVTHAIQEMVKYGFDNFDINRIFARPFGSNIASQRVLEKAGFQLEGRYDKTIFKNEKYEDELVYAIRK